MLILSARARLGLLLARREVPDCACGLAWEKLYLSGPPEGARKGVRGHEVRAPGKPCRHTLLCFHLTPLAEWAHDMRVHSPALYVPRLRLGPRAVAILHEDRIQVMFERELHGQNLFNPRDIHTLSRSGFLEQADGSTVRFLEPQLPRPDHVETRAERRARLLDWEAP